MSEELDGLIERKEAELSPFCSRMEELKIEFTRETVSFASEWYRKTAKDYIIKNPEVALSLTEERIAAMKTQVNELVRNAAKTVQAELDKPEVWWHLEPRLNESIERYHQVADKFPEVLDRPVRRALGRLGVVLEKFGFRVTASGYTGTYYEFWFERVGRETISLYPHILRWTDPMQDTVREYDAEYVEATEIYGEIQRLKGEKKKLEALNRWDSL